MRKTVKFVTKLLSAAAMLWSFSANATTDPPLLAREWKGSAGSVKVDSFRLVSDINYYASPGSIERTFSIRNMVLLGIDESSPFYVQTDFVVSITLEVTKTRPDNTDSVFQKILTVDYKKAEGQKFNAFQYITFTNGAKVKVKILSINTNGASWDVTRVLEIRNELTATRDYIFNCGTYVNGLSMAYEDPNLSKQDEVRASWSDPQNGQTEYDLEWVWIEESAWPLFQDGSNFDPAKVFQTTTRVTINQSSYKIPLLYGGKGKLFARVRPAQIKESGQRIEGVWSWSSAGIAGPAVAFDFDGHEENLNWQSSTTYSEDGKRKTVIQYFDGTLKARQIVTKDNVTLTTVVSETFFDYQGRAVLQVLPAPTINTIIQYAGNFNRFVDEAAYPKSMYDKLSPGEGICIKPASALSNSSGTSNYYSPSNSFLALPSGDSRKSEHDKFIPDGEGYPFSETRYTPDGTGRIATQSGVGPSQKLGSGHETKYFYESPDQKELDALFGTDAGYASHYFKNLVKDANGQYSVSYIDMHGRTIATALAGESPQNLQQLNSHNTRSITKNLLDNETNNVVGKSIISSKSIVVPQAGTYRFNYQLSPEKLNLLNCAQPPAPVCYDCYYDLIFTIKSDCGDLVTIPGKSNPYIVRNFTLNQYISNCTSNNGRSPGFEEEFDVLLAEGSYTITKELRLNTDAQNYYRENIFKPGNTCKTLQQFIDEQYQLLQSQTNCNLTCESCNTALGIYSQFRDRFIQQAGPFTAAELTALEPQILTAFNEAKANCDRICNTVTDDGFDAIRAIRDVMSTDMTPVTGQYAWMGTNDLTRKYNIFNTADNNGYELLPQSPPDWKRPQQWNGTNNTLEAGSYKDENGNTDPVNATLNTMSATQFATAFKSSWAESLLPHHPEYCKLLTTERFLKPSYQFEAAMNKASNWQEAATAGYIQNLINLDPFFANTSSPGYGYRNAMLQKMQEFIRDQDCNNNSVGVSMWQVALASVFCQKKDPLCSAPDNQVSCMLSQPVSPANNPAAGCSIDWDYAWKNYRSIYLSQRKMFISQYLNGQCGNVNNADILSYNIYTLRFPDLGTNNAPPTDIAHLNDLFTQLNNGNQGGAGTAGNNLMQEQYDITCRSYATMWINRLKECPATATAMTTADETWIIDNLVKICKAGSDLDHIQGSSSVPASAPPVYDPVYGINYREFPDVILKFLQLKGISISTLCHPWQIEFPKPYDKSPAITNQIVITKPKECECRQLTNLGFEYQQSGYAGTLSQYLAYQHGTYISQGALDTLTALCNGTYPCNFLPKPITIPPVMQCRGSNELPVKTCITCQEYENIRSAFAAQFGSAAPLADPQTQAHLQLNHAFEQFANYKTGFSKHWSEYVAFGNQCENITEISCTLLTNVLNQFYQQYPNPGTGTDCKQLFAQFFNNALGTFYTFDQIMNLYLLSCGSMPDVCRPKVDCAALKQIIQDFFDLYGASVFQNVNCSNLFTAYANQRLQTSYSYQRLQALYSYLCGCTLDICSFPNCHALSAVYAAFRLEYGPLIWAQGNCMSLFVEFFHEYFGFDPGTYTESQIIDFFNECYNSGCGPDIAGLCQPPYSCQTLQELINGFYIRYGGGVATQENCQTLFASYFNQQMGTNLTWLQIAILYRQVCGGILSVCQPKMECAKMQQLVTDFKNLVIYNSANCEELFTDYFNTEFGTDLTYSKIMQMYIKFCGEEPRICSDPIMITACEQLQAVITDFRGIYPDPGTELQGQCKEVFRQYFNNHFGTNYPDSVIQRYYLTLCGEALNICVSECSGYVNFVNQFNTRYVSLKLPADAKRQLFTYLFNQEYYPHQEGRRYDEIVDMLWNCLGQNQPVPVNSITYSIYDRDVLLSMKQVYYLLHPTGDVSDHEDGGVGQIGGIGINEGNGGCERDFTSWFNLSMRSDLDYAQIQALYESVVGPGAGAICDLGGDGKEAKGGGPAPTVNPPLLCGLNDPIFTPVDVNTDPCKDLVKFAIIRGEEMYELYVDSLRNVFDAAYLDKCLSVKNLESFTVMHNVSEYHYTLYYYDQAGQLVRTVPPEGVDTRHGDANFLNNVKIARANVANGQPMASNYVVPSHTLASDYRYNSLGELIKKKSPDGGLTEFWYDRIGRLVVSQNAQQRLDDKFSYTMYDGLGRIKEVGQKPQVAEPNSRNESALNTWLNGSNNKEEITKTIYDTRYGDPGLPEFGTLLIQRNLRNRVSYSQVWQRSDDLYARSATYYTYDIHGNVDTLLQDYGHSYYPNAMNSAGNRYKKMVYRFDLVSGNVTEVIYQPVYYNNDLGSWVTPADQFFHKYEYDVENKLTTVWTSHDSWIWEKDARYSYYKHGPLARVNLGQQQVQALDYANTIQGWMKGMNGGPEMDEVSGSQIAKDAYGFSLNYFESDYKSVVTNSNPFTTVLTPLGTGAAQLYNGNIAAMAVNIPRLGDAKVYNYHYDQLNRIVAMDAFDGLNVQAKTFTPVQLNDYKERVTYDANGNIKTYTRNGATAAGNQAMDVLSYAYNYSGGKLVNNRLRHVIDAVTGPGGNDIKTQGIDNYGYDEIGNLTSDLSEGINTNGIKWNVYGKLLSVTKGNSTITYTYDASGNRISKSFNGKTSWYVRDASGNVMSVYEKGNSTINNGELTQAEVHLYGSSRLGIFKMQRNVQTPDQGTTGISNFERGNKFFELSNHLDNVLVTVSDRKMGVQDPANTSQVLYYVAEVTTATDYYPGGMEMPGRSLNSSLYRFSINGQEKSFEIASNTTTAEFWQYDARIVRRWNVDPVVKEWESPYAAFYNNPVVFSDPNGDDAGRKARRRAKKDLEYYKSHGNPDATYNIENDNDGNIRVTFQANNPNEVKVLAGFTQKRSLVGRRLNQAKQFTVGVGEGLYETAKFAVNILNPDPDKNSLVQTGKFLYSAITDPKGTWNNIQQIFRETDWRSPKTWGKIFSNVAGAKGIDKFAKISKLSKVDNVVVELKVLDPATDVMRLNPATVRAVVDDGVVLMSSKAWPLKSLKPLSPSQIASGCEDVAKQIQASIGGEFLHITPLAGESFLGGVSYSGNYVNHLWSHHYAVIKGGIVYDAMTGAAGMPLSQYKLLFTDAKGVLNFTPVPTITKGF